MAWDALAVSTGVVALAEMGDKTQLLALLLAARFRRPLPIVLGIVVATVLNHALAGAVGAWLSTVLNPELIRWGLGLAFLAMAGWLLIPDRIEEDEVRLAARWGVFGTTALAFFLAEMADKTQVATVALTVHYTAPVAVVVGTTLGMLMADVPAVFVGDRLARHVPMRLVHGIAALVFAVLGLATLFGLGERWGF
ncbi:MAG: TMEM165/GDT1 family protein [Tepidimonas sp.]|uniref:TMEM165/GDT1 family protein n=1 Tax=Tepidimonas sp. TaxID=2002775 RepID=UPI00298F2A96|nr:TMEM165/GDT1 family protein [Tepidimonas sp.]MDW8336311.1 TMEM165/GDT1 family protein [Tepidimonas sp.]